MARSRRKPFFTCRLYPQPLSAAGGAVIRFAVPTACQVSRASGTGVVGVPFPLNSLLACDEHFFPVLPYNVRRLARIHTVPLAEAAPSWRGVPCDLARAECWILNERKQQLNRFPLTRVLLPRTPLADEPNCPLLGQELFQRYSFRARLDFSALPEALAASPPLPVGALAFD